MTFLPTPVAVFQSWYLLSLLHLTLTARAFLEHSFSVLRGTVLLPLPLCLSVHLDAGESMFSSSSQVQIYAWCFYHVLVEVSDLSYKLGGLIKV